MIFYIIGFCHKPWIAYSQKQDTTTVNIRCIWHPSTAFLGSVYFVNGPLAPFVKLFLIQADKLCEGSLTPLLSQLVSSPELSTEELAVLRKLVEGRDRRDRS